MQFAFSAAVGMLGFAQQKPHTHLCTSPNENDIEHIQSFISHRSIDCMHDAGIDMFLHRLSNRAHWLFCFWHAHRELWLHRAVQACFSCLYLLGQAVCAIANWIKILLHWCPCSNFFPTAIAVLQRVPGLGTVLESRPFKRVCNKQFDLLLNLVSA